VASRCSAWPRRTHRPGLARPFPRASAECRYCPHQSGRTVSLPALVRGRSAARVEVIPGERPAHGATGDCWTRSVGHHDEPVVLGSDGLVEHPRVVRLRVPVGYPVPPPEHRGAKLPAGLCRWASYCAHTRPACLRAMILPPTRYASRCRSYSTSPSSPLATRSTWSRNFLPSAAAHSAACSLRPHCPASCSPTPPARQTSGRVAWRA
jgi:hypothetical protein